jgi:hypothetical protein
MRSAAIHERQYSLQCAEMITFGASPSKSLMSQLRRLSTKGCGGAFGASGGTLMLMVWLMIVVLLDELPMLRIV